MKTRYTVAFSMLVGAALGAATIHGLHAQAKPPAYVIAENEVSNPAAYAKEYAPFASKALMAAGAKFLVRGGQAVSIAGTPPKSRVIVFAFESMEQAQAAFGSPAYREAKKIGEKYAKFRIYAVEGVAK